MFWFIGQTNKLGQPQTIPSTPVLPLYQKQGGKLHFNSNETVISLSRNILLRFRGEVSTLEAYLLVVLRHLSDRPDLTEPSNSITYLACRIARYRPAIVVSGFDLLY